MRLGHTLILIPVVLAGCGQSQDAVGPVDRDWPVLANASGVSIKYPSDWHSSGDPLTKVIWPPGIFAVASYPLAQARPDPECAPVTAREAMPRHGAFIYVFEMTGAPAMDSASADEFPRRPEHFELGRAERYECFGSAYAVNFREEDRSFQAMVALGPDAPERTRKIVLAVLNSFHVRRRADVRQNVEAEWLRFRVPNSWSTRAVTGALSVATPVAAGWAKTVSVTTAPFDLPADLGYHEFSLTIPRRSFQLWLVGSRESRSDARRPIDISLSLADRVERPPPGADLQFTRTVTTGDRRITATASLDRQADVSAVLGEVNRVLRTLEATE
ncbi:MAG: hypothetical protein H0V11_07610 [Actinobacteria bacterium]|nr:hypothetical protein [Actinomycetota bacterium]